MRKSFLLMLALLCTGMLLLPAVPGRAFDVRVTDAPYNATTAATMTSRQRAAAIQHAVDDVGRAGGGTITISGDTNPWMIDRPIFIGYPNVTITGEGDGTTIKSEGIAVSTPYFLLGMKTQYADAPLTANHFPDITAVLDGSPGARYGLRTYDAKNHVSAAGYFNACPFSVGAIVTQGGRYRPSDLNSGLSKFTLDLCVQNNGTGVMKGVICGVGPGGSHGNITDPQTVYTIESDPATGKNVSFKYKVVDAKGVESTKTLLFSAAALGKGAYRFSVQIDFTAGKARAWFSDNHVQPAPYTPVLTARDDTLTGDTFKANEYGAFRLGAVTDSSFSGTPSDGTGVNGDWTYCGLCADCALQYSTTPANDILGVTQKMSTDNTTITSDNYRYFTCDPVKNLAYLPLQTAFDPAAPSSLVYWWGNNYTASYGYWLPNRKQAPLAGTVTVRDLIAYCQGSFEVPFVIGEVSHAAILDINEVGSGFQGIGGMDCNPPGCQVTASDCALVGTDAMFFGKAVDVHAESLQGAVPWLYARLVGGSGEFSMTMLGDFMAAPEYLVKVHSGPYGGPLTFRLICLDEETGATFSKGGIYAEPSLDGKLDLRLLGFSPGGLPAGTALVELADAPGTTYPIAHITQTGGANTKCDVVCPDAVVLCHSPHWYGRISNMSKGTLLAYGPIKYDGAGQCHIVCYHTDFTGIPKPPAWVNNHWYLGDADNGFLAQDMVTGPDGYDYLCISSAYWHPKNIGDHQSSDGTVPVDQVNHANGPFIPDNRPISPLSPEAAKYWLKMGTTGTSPNCWHWLAGCHVIQVLDAGKGAPPHYTYYRCTKSGQYGTGHPADEPTWVGSDPLP